MPGDRRTETSPLALNTIEAVVEPTTTRETVTVSRPPTVNGTHIARTWSVRRSLTHRSFAQNFA